MSDSTEARALYLPTAGTAVAVLLHEAAPASTIRTIDWPSGRTDTSPWERPENPQAGVSELVWFEEHKGDLATYQGLWVGILGQRVVASGHSIINVRQEIDRQGIHDALVVRVPDNVTQREYFIG